MANDALAPSKRRKSDPAGPQLHRAADADVQERGVFQEPEAHPADARHPLAQEEMRLLQAELSQARAACADKDSEILYLQNSREEMRLLEMELSRARAACADKDSEKLYLQNLVVRLQPLVVPCRMLAAAFPPPPVVSTMTCQAAATTTASRGRSPACASSALQYLVPKP